MDFERTIEALSSENILYVNFLSLPRFCLKLMWCFILEIIGTEN